MSGRHPQRPAHAYSYQEPSSSSYRPANLNFTDQEVDSYSASSSHRSSETPSNYNDARSSRGSQSDAVKHRRSRSGCYTCRGRRVKCDESRPTCDRCRKGKRECIYPEPPRPTRTGQKTKAVPEEVLSSTEEQDVTGADEENSGQDTLRGDESDTPSLTPSNSKSLSPSTQGSTPRLYFQELPHQPPPKGTGMTDTYGRYREGSSSSRDASASLSPPVSDDSPSSLPQEVKKPRPSVRRLRSDLSPALRFYLDYQRNHMSFHHYGLTLDARGFLHSYLIGQALSNDALLYAVVAFAAYHHTVRRSDGSVQDFLGYYSKSLSLLRQSLQSSQRRTVADLLTMLQLAVLEEHLGDWVTLLNHQKAAFSILTSIYTPHSLLEDDSTNKIVEWYIRFDLYAAFISGNETLLVRDWFAAQVRFYARQVREFPNDLGYKWEERNASARMLAKDVSTLFHRRGKAAITESEFNIEASTLSRRFATWYRDLSPMILDPAKVLKDLPRELSRILVDAEDPWSDVVIYGEDLWPTNHMLVHFWSVELMFNHHLALLQRRPPPADIAIMALKICQVYEAIESRDPEPGAILGVQGSVGMASVHLRKEDQLTMWFRRKQALVEANGYVYPAAFRHKMSNAWNVDVAHWWLPDDEGFTPILRSIREFIEYRTLPARDRATEDLRDMSGIFENLNLNTS